MKQLEVNGLGMLAFLGKTIILLMAAFSLLAMPQQTETSSSSIPLTFATKGPHLYVELITQTQQIPLDRPFWIALHFQPAPGWHTYWRNPGDSGEPPKVKWDLPGGLEIGPAQWPIPTSIDVEHLRNFGYKGESLLLFEARYTPKATPAPTLRFFADLTWLVCAKECIPGSGSVTLSMPTAEAAQVNTAKQDLFSQFLARLPDSTIRPVNANIGDDKLRLQFETALPKDATLQFFPLQENLIENQSQQRWEIKDETTVATIPLNALFFKAPKVIEGLVTVNNQSGFYVSGPVTMATIDESENYQDKTTQTAGLENNVLSLGIAASFAFLGGLILNIMPCVFPVLALKALSFSKLNDRRSALQYGLAYTVGVVVSFWLIALTLVVFRHLGNAADWGFQLQSPGFVTALIYFFFLMAFSLLGAFTPGTRLMGIGGDVSQVPGIRGALTTGVLAVVVASPCSAPLMAPAIGYALQTSSLEAIIIFSSLGLGFALPLMLLAIYPNSHRLLPAPGPWLQTFKEAMAFPLLLTVIWLLWVLAGLRSATQVALVSSGLVAIGAVLWLLPKKPSATRFVAISMLLIAAAYPFFTRQADSSHQEFYEKTTFSLTDLEARRAKGEKIFVNLTADWCITCKVNEAAVLNTEGLKNLFKQEKIVYMVGDFTKPNSEISAHLNRFQRSGVPLYLFYDGEAPAIVLPQLLSYREVETAIRKNRLE